MNNKTIEKSLSILNLESKILEKLNKNNIFYIKDLWQLKRNDLKDIGLNDHEIKNIIIKLQLNSIDLNKKIYNKNF